MPDPDIAAARLFLQGFDPEAEFCTVQTFDDTSAKRGALAKIAHIDPANGALDSLADFNNQGAGIFFCVNATDGKGRQAHNVQRVRAVFLDLDGTPLGPVLEAGLEPHVVVESSPGKFHVYWRVDDCPLDQFERVQRALARRFHGDPSVNDLPRVLRIPGFLHRKAEPFLSHVVEGVGFNGPPYTLAEIVGRLGLELDAPDPPRRAQPSSNSKIEPGARHDHLFAVGRSMARKGLSREAVAAALAAENDTRCDPPLGAADVEYLAGRAFTAKHAHDRQEAPPSDDHDDPRAGVPPQGDEAPPLDAQPRRRALKLLTVRELLEAPRPVWIVRGLLQEGALGVVYGEPGCGKSFLVADLAAAIVRGMPWFGRRTRQGRAVYVCCEGSLRNRLEAYLSVNGLADLPGLHIHNSAINLLDPTADVVPLINALHAVADADGPVAVVVVDTLNRAMPGGNENSPEDMGTVLAAAMRIQEATGAAVVFVHHCGKDASKGSRGHSSLKGAADLELAVAADETGNRSVAATKVKDGEDGATFGFRLRPVDLGPSTDPDAAPDEHESSCVIEVAAVPKPTRKPARRDVALDALREALAEVGTKLPGTSTIPAGVRAVTLDQWKARWTLRTGYDDGKTESIRVNFDKDRAALLNAGTITISKPYVWIAA